MRQSRFIQARRLWCCVVVVLCLAPAVLRASDEIPAARAYWDWLQQAVAAIESDLPTISASADAAAQRWIDGGELSVRGDIGLHQELTYRAGGLNGFTGKPTSSPTDQSVVLYALGIATREQPDAAALLAQQLDDCRALREAGAMVIAIASKQQLQSLNLLEKATASCTTVLDNHAPAGDGFFPDAAQGRPMAPTFVTANPVVAWAWSAELFAACTRRGKTPVVLQSVMVKGARDRNARYKGQRFHEDLQVAAIEPGVLGKAYTTELNKLLGEIGTQSWEQMVKAAETMRDVLRDGDRVVIHAVGHYPPHHVAGQLHADPGLFTPLARAIDKRRPNELATTDFALVVGYSWLPLDPQWKNGELLESAGRGICYTLSAYEDRSAVQDEKRIIIDQLWAAGDALVKVPGYDVRLGPPSGVISEAIIWSLVGQLRSPLN
jgi:uncharacterized phosphosugar-binding protein